MSKYDGFDFCVEYAKSNRSACKSCKEKINQDEIRLGQMVQAANFDGRIPLWNHFDCFFKQNYGFTSMDMLHGKEQVRPADLDRIAAKVGGDSGGGAKRKAGADGGASKKAKGGDDGSLEAERAALWKIRDDLKLNCTTAELREILEHNGQPSNGGESKLIERCATHMLFGNFPPCPECGGRVVIGNGCFHCTGDASEYAKCTWSTEEHLKVIPWDMPEMDNDYLDKFKFKARKKLLIKEKIVKVDKPAAKAAVKAWEETASATPLEGMVLCVAGNLSLPQATVKKHIAALGGTFAASCTAKVTHCISTLPEVNAGTHKVIQACLAKNVPIFSEDILTESLSQKKKLYFPKWLIGGTADAKATVFAAYPKGTKSEETFELKDEDLKKKIKWKGRGFVEPSAGDDAVENYHILDEGGLMIYDATLSKADITTGKNSYYILQVLQHDKKPSECCLFRSWGRTGTTIGGTKLEDPTTKAAAVSLFEKLYEEKSGNVWRQRETRFQKNAGLMVEIEKKREPPKAGEDETMAALSAKMAKGGSGLDRRVQDILSLIFDVKMMEDTLLEMEINLKEMPLGDLSKGHIKRGLNVLQRIEKVLESAAEAREKEKQLLSLTNEFYTLIPHDFGVKAPTLINSPEALKAKMTMMEALTDIEIATSLLKSSSSSSTDTIMDANYKKLNTDLSPVDHNSEEFKWINTYCNNQKGRFKLDLLEVMKVNRHGCEADLETVKNMGNKMLLWHGSRMTNYTGILSQGLRIAPPEAPKSGYRFGKGVYFADLCEKSAVYCRGKGSDYILMMLCEVTLGRVKELLRDQYMEKPLPGSDSTKAMGAIAPGDSFQLGDVTVPWGKPVNTGVKSSCSHDEFIIYNTNQACIRYLLKLKMVD